MQFDIRFGRRALGPAFILACGNDVVGDADATSTGFGAPGGSDAPITTTGDPDKPGKPDPTTGGPDGPGTTTDGSTDAGRPVLALSFEPIKQFRFTWTAVADADWYRLYERRPGTDDYGPLGDPLPAGTTSIAWTMPLHLRWGAEYFVRACVEGACVDSEPVRVVDSMVDAIGYFKRPFDTWDGSFGRSVALSADGSVLAVSSENTHGGLIHVFERTEGVWQQEAYIPAPGVSDRWFGWDIDLSDDGHTLAVSSVAGLDDPNAEPDAPDAGAVYVYVRDGGWSLQTLIESPHVGADDSFGWDIDLSADGGTLVVGARGDDSAATGIDGDPDDVSAEDAGAAYVFAQANGAWSQQAYVKASNTGAKDSFGDGVALSSAGDVLAVGAPGEDSAADIDGDQSDDSAEDAGAIYIFTRLDGQWAQRAYVKTAAPEPDAMVGSPLALSADGRTLAAGPSWAGDLGLVFVFHRSTDEWSQQASVAASNADRAEFFGWPLALSADGNVLAVGAFGERGEAVGINGDQTDYNFYFPSGSAYVFSRAGATWTQRAYVKASNQLGGSFGDSIALSADGDTLAVGDLSEQGAATGIGGDQTKEAQWSHSYGAVYLY